VHPVLDVPAKDLFADLISSTLNAMHHGSMDRAVANLLGIIAMLLTCLLWLSLLDAGRADRFLDNLAGAQNEYKIVLGTALLAVVLAFVAAIRGAKPWLLGLVFSVGTLGFFTHALSR
jgi:hypothetical protein